MKRVGQGLETPLCQLLVVISILYQEDTCIFPTIGTEVDIYSLRISAMGLRREHNRNRKVLVIPGPVE